MDGSSLDQCPLDETNALHPVTFPRDGHLPHDGALGSSEFPAKPAVTEWRGLDEMEPWLRVRDADCLLQCDRTVH